MFEEFDILLLGGLAGAYGQFALFPRSGERVPTRLGVALPAFLALSGLLSLFKGFTSAGGVAFDWFAGYTDALNSLRVFKSLGFGLLYLPLLQYELATHPARAARFLASGMVGGLCVVVFAVLWERAAFPGLWAFSAPYRTVALFWEMHVGGAAIDCYLALASPFVVRGLVAARRPAAWGVMALLALMVAYACLTTFSRGVYLAVAVSMALLAGLLWAQRVRARGGIGGWNRRLSQRWRAGGSALLLLALAGEVALVMGAGSFMTARLASTDRDLGSRWAHWQHGLDLLGGAGDWVMGIGLGRLPAGLAAQAPQSEFPGDLRLGREWRADGAINTYATLYGPNTLKKLAGDYALTQRVGPLQGGAYQVRLNVRAPLGTEIVVAVCERHLLFEGHCVEKWLDVPPSANAWQGMAVVLENHALPDALSWPPRLVMFSITVVKVRGRVDVDAIRLVGPDQQQLLKNGDFSREMAHWFTASHAYFLPWHLDQFFLELLVERGLLGWLPHLALLALAFWNLTGGAAREQALAPYLAASLCAVTLVGAVSSLMDVPRVAFLFYLLVLFSMEISGTSQSVPFAQTD